MAAFIFLMVGLILGTILTRALNRAETLEAKLKDKGWDSDKS